MFWWLSLKLVLGKCHGNCLIFTVKKKEKKKRLVFCISKEQANMAGKESVLHGLFSSSMIVFRLKQCLISVPNIVLSFFDAACVLMSAQDKLQSLAAGHSDILETLSPKVRKRVEVLREVQVSLPSNSLCY